MPDEVRRGYVITDAEQFSSKSISILKKAQVELLFLLERGYPIKSASTFVGNHYLLSERQRIAIVRATAKRSVIGMRRQKEVTKSVEGEEVYIDGLNLIITLEVALSASTLIKCMDGTIRDLAGLRGTYRIIDKTEQAIRLIGDTLAELRIAKAVFYLDAPVSNTGRLKTKILELLEDYPFQVTVELTNHVDQILQQSDLVVTSDAIILNACKGYLNLAYRIIENRLPGVNFIDLSMVNGEFTKGGCC